MKKILNFAAGYGLSATFVYAILIFIVVALGAFLFGYCRGGKRAEPIAPVDPVLIEKLASKNAETRNAALEKVFEQADTERRISDEKRAEIRREVEKNSKYGKQVTAEDFRALLEEKIDEK